MYILLYLDKLLSSLSSFCRIILEKNNTHMTDPNKQIIINNLEI